jgi:hypothetical protein
MPAAQYEYQNFVAANVATPNATEGIVCTTRAVSSAYASSSFGIQFSGIFTAGATTTSVRFQIRQGSLTGTSIFNSGLLSITAAQLVDVFFAAIDTITGESTGAIWVLTAAQTAGTAPGGLTNGFSSVAVPV